MCDITHQGLVGNRHATDLVVVEHHPLPNSRERHAPSHFGGDPRTFVVNFGGINQHQRGEHAGKHGIRLDTPGPHPLVERPVEDEKASRIPALMKGDKGLPDEYTKRTAQGFLAAG